MYFDFSSNKAQLEKKQVNIFDQSIFTPTIYLPHPLDLKFPVHKLSCGDHHTMFLSTSGELYSFGNNESGQLGLGETETNFYTPIRVPLFIKLSDISCGPNYSICLSEESRMLMTGKIF